MTGVQQRLAFVDEVSYIGADRETRDRYDRLAGVVEEIVGEYEPDIEGLGLFDQEDIETAEADGFKDACLRILAGVEKMRTAGVIREVAQPDVSAIVTRIRAMMEEGPDGDA